MFGLLLSHLIRDKTHHTKAFSKPESYSSQVVLLKAGEILLQRSKTKVLHERLACEKHIAIHSNMGHQLLRRVLLG